jgi:hypothetical protein
MVDAMNNASSNNVDFDKKIMKVSYMVTLSCFM